MKSLTDKLEEALSTEAQNAEGLHTPSQVAYVVNQQDPMMAAVLRIIDEAQQLKAELFVARLLFLGCPDHPEYRPLVVVEGDGNNWKAEVKSNPHPDCPLCKALEQLATTYKKEYLKDQDGSIHDDGTTAGSV